MPTYEYECGWCGSIAERVNTVAQRHNAPTCDCTGAIYPWPMHLIISAPAIRADNLDAQSYYDHGLGTRITSRSQRRQLMKANNLVEADTGTVRPHGAKGTVFSFAGQATQSVAPNGAFARKG